MRIRGRISDSKGNNSVIYLALLCLLYLLFTSSYIPVPHSPEPRADVEQPTYIEITRDGKSTVTVYENPGELYDLKREYPLERDLKSGDRIIVNGSDVAVESMSGRKKISLGVPIGINSATHEDLTAISGIGDELAQRIINYRTLAGGIKSIDELDIIEGIGEIKLKAIKSAANLD